MAEKLILDMTTKLQLAQNSSSQESCSKSIYRIPKILTDVNSQAFKPKLAFFGPYHHNCHHFRPMEQHKHRALIQFLRRIAKASKTPLLALTTLATIDGSEIGDVNTLIKDFYNLSSASPKDQISDECFHILDLYRKILTSEGEYLPSYEKNIQSATKLKNVGVSFCKSKTNSFRDISFNGGILSLPQLKVDDTTASSFLNLMAFERLHATTGNEVTTYVFFMDDLIKTADDVAILRNEEIIKSLVDSDENIFKIFSKITKEAKLAGLMDDIVGVNNKFNTYCKKMMHRWRANFVETYLKSLWVFFSLHGGLLLLALTIFNTMCTILRYYKA